MMILPWLCAVCALQERFYGERICVTSRAALMTGRYPEIRNVYSSSTLGMKRDQVVNDDFYNLLC